MLRHNPFAMNELKIPFIRFRGSRFGSRESGIEIWVRLSEYSNSDHR